MNLLQAEDELEGFKPHIAYLSHGTINQEKEGEKDFLNYLNLKTQIFESKDKYHLTALEFALECLEEEKYFYNVDIMPMLYKDFVSQSNLDYCRKKLAEIEDEIVELETTLKHRKELARL